MKGRSIDTNFAYIARQLNSLGHDVSFHSCYQDNIKDLQKGIKTALSRAGIIILTGGLGPTQDDLSREAVAKATGHRLIFNPMQYKQLCAKYRSLGLKIPSTAKKQVNFPYGSEVIPNPVGIAPGFILRYRSKLVFVLPGVPREMQSMLKEVIFNIKPIAPDKLEKSYKIFGIPEAEVELKFLKIIKDENNISYGITAKSGTITIIMRITSEDPHETLKRIEQKIKKIFRESFFGMDYDTIEDATANLLMRKNKTIAIAESCTGGLVSNKLTDIPGISKSLIESIVTYSNESKIQRLGVDPNLIGKFGAVSKQAAIAMARGIRSTTRADIGLSTTGIAGPAGAHLKKPVGLVYIGLATSDCEKAEKFIFPGNRLEIKDRATDYAINLVRLYLLGAR